MPYDTSNLPISGGVIVAGLAYVALTYFVTADVIGERTIAKSDWNKQCTTHLRALILNDVPQQEFIPKLDCNSIMGLFGAQGRAVCNKHGNPSFNLPFLDQLNDQKRRVNEYKQKRLQSTASQVGSKCDCAVSVSLEKNRSAWALYAGSARLVTPHSVKNFSSELQSALNSSHCAPNK
ncbi:MAG: hypothetical protein OCD03_09435 [Hyphomicrobiales bacterium]